MRLNPNDTRSVLLVAALTAVLWIIAAADVTVHIGR
jgi:hypothetical protein